MSFYHWFSSHPNEKALSGEVAKLQDIGKELKIFDPRQPQRQEQTDFCRISSVPDIWSQHRLFEMLLLNTAEDPSYLEYEAIAKREWRAMLTLLVLAESYGVEIKSETIRFSDAVSNPYLRAAYDSRPSAELWPSMDVYYVTVRNEKHPIAVSSPSVHVIPTRNAWDILKAEFEKKIPWLTADMVNAPVVETNGVATPFMLGEIDMEHTPALIPVHALILQRWITKYRTDMVARQKKEKNSCSLQNTRMLLDFETALIEAYGLDPDKMPKVDSFFATAEHQEGLKIGETTVVRNLQVFLNSVFYSVIDNNSSLPEILNTHRLAGGIGKQCIISKRQQNNQTAHFFVAMPVTPTLWKLLEYNEELKPTYATHPVFSPDGLSLRRLTVSVVIGGIMFSKTYGIEQIMQEQWRNLCTAGIWPRQKIENWQDYFFCCNEIGGYNLKPAGSDMITQMKSYRGKESLEGVLHHYKLSASPALFRLEKNGELIGYLKTCEQEVIPAGDTAKVYHAALDFGTSATTLYGGVEEETPTKLSGMNLWSLPLMNSFDLEGSDTSRLEQYFFPPLPVPLNLRGNSGVQEATRYNYEVLLNQPNIEQEYPYCIPLQTILSDASEENSARQMLVDSWIYLRAFIIPRKELNWPKKYSNLKWNRSVQADQFRIKAILSEFLMMLSLEARVKRCGRISLTASYPLSFETRIKETYFHSLNEMLMITANRAGVIVVPPSSEESKTSDQAQTNNRLVGSITESEAVYRYSIKQDSYNQNYFVVDIGGGSTDIFISLVDEKHRRNSYSASLGFGARKVLIDKICDNNSEILRKLMENSSLNASQILRDNTIFLRQLEAKNGMHSMVEDLFSFRVKQDMTNAAAANSPDSYGDAFIITCAQSVLDENLKKSDTKAYSEGKSFLELKKRIAFYLGASVWLSGRMIRGGENTDMEVSLLFAGNGSKMIQWLSPDLERIRYFITLLFQKAAQSAITKEQMRCRFSAKPKEEVAYGALVDFPAGFAAAQKTATQRIAFGSAQETEDETPAFRSMQYVSTNIETDADEFAEFLHEFRQSAKWSFDWEFSKDEYSADLLKQGGLRTAIAQAEPDCGYFLSALEVIAAQYLKKDPTSMSI